MTFPDNTTLLVDGGGQPGPFKTSTPVEIGEDGNGQFESDRRRIGESVVSEYLWWRGLDHIDYILATHADADHIDGLNDVARNFAVRAALVARIPNGDPEYSEFTKTMSFKRVPIRTVGGGDELKFGDVSVAVMWPVAFTNPASPSGNNDSVVLRLRYGKRSILLTGDIEAPAEKRILESDEISRENLRADIVKVAHHGSKSSSTESFIAATEPSHAIISVGQTSVFGHPHRTVVERWRDAGARILTTGHCGTITVSTDGSDLKVSSFISGRPDGSLLNSSDSVCGQ